MLTEPSILSRVEYDLESFAETPSSPETEISMIGFARNVMLRMLRLGAFRVLRFIDGAGILENARRWKLK
jgi:hypothetical protein